MSPEAKNVDQRTFSVFRVINIFTGLHIIEGAQKQYALSLVLQSQPQLILSGPHQDQISRGQMYCVAEGIVAAGEHYWKNLNPNYKNLLTPELIDRLRKNS